MIVDAIDAAVAAEPSDPNESSDSRTTTRLVTMQKGGRNARRLLPETFARSVRERGRVGSLVS